MEVAHYLVEQGPWGPQHLYRMLGILQGGTFGRQLVAAAVARCPLTPAQWTQVPLACPRLGTALPAVLQRSEAEAAVLVRRMPAGEQHYLRTLALYLGAAQRRGHLPSLPVPITDRLLAECAAHFATELPQKQRAWQQQQQQQQAALLPDLGLLAAAVAAVVAAAAALICLLKGT